MDRCSMAAFVYSSVFARDVNCPEDVHVHGTLSRPATRCFSYRNCSRLHARMPCRSCSNRIGLMWAASGLSTRMYQILAAFGEEFPSKLPAKINIKKHIAGLQLGVPIGTSFTDLGSPAQKGQARVHLQVDLRLAAAVTPARRHCRLAVARRAGCH
jgi:hypothetical protein